jgi:hypothetical protein
MARRPWVFSSFRATVGSDVTDPLCQNLHVAAKSFAAIADNGDLAAFGDWITNHGGVDYLSVDSLATAKARSAQPLVALTQTSLASPARPGDPVNIGRE